MQDPKALAKPWTTSFYYELRPKWELGEISRPGDYLASISLRTLRIQSDHQTRTSVSEILPFVSVAF